MRFLRIINYFCLKLITNLVILYFYFKTFSSFIIEVIIILFKKLFEKLKNFCVIKFGRFIGLLILIYEIISLVIDYSKCETNIDMQTVLKMKWRPTFTFCFKTRTEFPQKFQSLFLKENLINRSIVPNIIQTVRPIIFITEI